MSSKTTTARDILALALKQVGVKDKPIGSCNNKYNTAYYGGPVNNPALAWCVVFIWWLFQQLGASALFCGGRKMASVPAAYTRCKQAGGIVTDPLPGDIVFFDFNRNGTPDHIGIVYQVKANGSVVTIEGNTSGISQSNGGCVQQKTRTKAQIFALARPNYAAGTSSTSAKKTESDDVRAFIKAIQKALGVTADGIAGPKTLKATITVSRYRNRSHAVVKVLQERLNALGYDAGAVDGIAGPKFTAAVKAFQKQNGCVADGVLNAGAQTWQKLLS